MLKSKLGPMGVMLVMAVGGVVACGSSNNSAVGTGGMHGSSGGAAGGSSSGSGGAGGAPTSAGSGGAGGAGGASATGGAITTLDAACARNCSFAAGLTTDPAGNVPEGCATTMEVCVASCLKTFENTSAVKADLGRQYKEMMICVAKDAKFSSPSGFVCAKPERALNKWSPGPGSDDCEQLICDWNCADGTKGNFDPFVDIRCACSSV